jgi:hypothetical protein
MAKVPRASRGHSSGGARAEAKKELLVQALGSWAREELKFEESSIPAPEELKL